MLDQPSYSRDIYGSEFYIEACDDLQVFCRKRCSQLVAQGYDVDNSPVRDSATGDLIVVDVDTTYHGVAADQYTIMSPHYETLAGGTECTSNVYVGDCNICWEFTHDTAGATIQATVTTDLLDSSLGTNPSCLNDFVVVTGPTDGSDSGNLCGAATQVITTTDDMLICYVTNTNDAAGAGFTATVLYL